MNERINADFGFSSTAADVIAGIDLAGRRVIVTGASSGIGVETARVLAGAGAEVTLAVRDVQAGRMIADAITAQSGARVAVGRLDLSNLVSISEFVSAWRGPLHILINNAGVMALPTLRLTPAGWETQFATNHVGHFALACGLRSALAAAGGARIVSLSSNAHLMSPVVFEDINFARREYDQWAAYGQSKTANVLFAVGATARWQGEGITANAVHPGVIADTNLSRHLDKELVRQIRASVTFRYKSIEQGAATSVLVATSPALEGIGGRYFEDCADAEPVTGTQQELAAMRSGVAPYAQDKALAEKLWDLSEAASR